MSSYKLVLALMASVALSGCLAGATQLTPIEEETRAQLDNSKYQPAPRQIRDNIETQEVLAQAAFWSNEYNLNPADLEAAIKFSAVLRKLGNPSRAVEVTRTSRALYPKNPYLNAEHAAALIANQQVRPAIKIIDTSLKDAPSYARLWSLKGVALDQMEKYTEARSYYQRALRITPQDPNVMANLGLNFALAGDPHTAHQWLSRAASHPTASDSVHANLELVENLVAQSGLRPSAPSPQAAYKQPAYQPQSYRPQTNQPAAAPRQYGSYQARTAPQKTAAAPQARFTPQAFQAPAAPQLKSQTARLAGPASLPAQTAPINKPAATPQDVLSRIAKNVGPKSALAPQAPQQQYTGRTAQAYAPASTPPAQYSAAPQQTAAPSNVAPQYGQGYPAPQTPYYNNAPQTYADTLQRRPAARRRG